MKPYHVSVSAEAFAAALFAQIDFDVSVQYGANQPEYDLLVSKGNQILKISVKGSQDGGWGLAQSYKERGNTYHDAIELWKSSHQYKHVIYCLVQFENVSVGEMPRVYLATISEIARHLKTQRSGNGHCSLHENHIYASGIGRGYNDKIPDEWKFSVQRVEQLINGAG